MPLPVQTSTTATILTVNQNSVDQPEAAVVKLKTKKKRTNPLKEYYSCLSRESSILEYIDFGLHFASVTDSNQDESPDKDKDYNPCLRNVSEEPVGKISVTLNENGDEVVIENIEDSYEEMGNVVLARPNVCRSYYLVDLFCAEWHPGKT